LPIRQALRIVGDGLWALFTVVIILGGILSGIFTATESASVACVYAFFVTMFVYRDYKWSDMPKLVHRVVKTVGMVMILIGFAAGFGYLMAMMQIPRAITTAFLTVSENKYVILMLINIMFLVLGTLMDMAPLILICTPILMPVIATFGIDPVHFGILMMVNLGIGLITPPVGSTLFVGCAVSGLTMEKVVKELWPFYIAMLFSLAMVTYVPAITLWIPKTFLG
jgi:tripartite ATP-independent transporter DctM subunit